MLEEGLCQRVLILAIKASTNSQALKAVADIVQAVAVWSKIQVLNFGHPKKVAYHGLKLQSLLLRGSKGWPLLISEVNPCCAIIYGFFLLNTSYHIRKRKGGSWV